jgi:hypothetical protein
LFAASPFFQADRIGTATSHHHGSGSANSVGDLIIVDLPRYQAKDQVPIQEVNLDFQFWRGQRFFEPWEKVDSAEPGRKRTKAASGWERDGW